MERILECQEVIISLLLEVVIDRYWNSNSITRKKRTKGWYSYCYFKVPRVSKMTKIAD